MSRDSAAIILAAGSGSRMRQTNPDTNYIKNSNDSFKKEFLSVNSKPIIYYSVKAFCDTGLFKKIIVTLRPEDKNKAIEILSPLNSEIIIAEGGNSRQESVFNSLKEIAKDDPPKWVFIHDGARPFIDPDLIQRIYKELPTKRAVIPVTGSVDAMKSIDPFGKITAHLIRKETVSAQTPQAFEFSSILKAHTRAKGVDWEFIDDSEIWGKFTGDVYTVKGSLSNKKITFSHDLKGGQ